MFFHRNNTTAPRSKAQSIPIRPFVIMSVVAVSASLWISVAWYALF